MSKEIKVRNYSINGVICILAQAGTIMGLDISSMAVFMTLDEFKVYFHNPTTFLQGAMAASTPAGAFFGCLIAGLLAEKIGSVNSFRMASSFWLIGSIISVFVTSVLTVCLGRVVKGLAVGMFVAHLPAYVADTMPKQKKEYTMSIVQWCLTWGILIMFIISYGCIMIKTNVQSFRIGWGLESVPSIIMLMLSFSLPESPRFSINQKRWSEAKNVLINFKCVPVSKKSENEIFGDADIALDAFNLDSNNSKSCSVYDLLSDSVLIKHVLVGAFVQIFIQLTGINVLMYFLVFICEMIGLNDGAKLLATSLQYLINVLFTIFPIFFLGKSRRKDVLVFGAFTLGTCLVLISGIMGFCGRQIPPLAGNLAVQWEVKGKPGAVVLALCYIFVAVFASTVACAGWIYTEEIFPKRAKSKGTAVCLSMSWILTAILTFAGPVLLQYLKWATFLLFGIVCLISCAVIVFVFPETYGKSDSAVESFFIKKDNKSHFNQESQGEKKSISKGNSNKLKKSPNIPTVTKSVTASLNINTPESNCYIVGNSGKPRDPIILKNDSDINFGMSPFTRDSKSSSLFGKPINIIDSYNYQQSPFDNISDSREKFKVNR